MEALLARAVPDDAPARVRETLNRAARKVAFVGLRGLQERDRVLDRLRARGIGPVVLLKGAALGWLVYPDPLLRPMNDLDLLLPRHAVGAAEAALADLGYTAIDVYPGRPASRRASHERLFGRALVPGRVNQAIELHTAFASDVRHPVEYDAVLARSLSFPEGGPGARRLDETDQLLHLAIHLGKEQLLSPLKHLLDVHLWLVRGRFDPGAAIRRALRWGAATTLHEVLRLAQVVFGSPVPPELTLALQPGRMRAGYLRWWHAPGTGRVIGREVPMRSAQAAALLPLLDTPRQRIRVVARYGWARLRDAAEARSARPG